MRDAAAYLEQLQALLPQGPAWPRDADASLTGLLGGLADGMARVDGRALALLEESDPATTLELLPEWERAVGLPDPCYPGGGSVRDRQLAIARRLADTGGQSRAFYVQIALLIGLEIEVIEFSPFTPGSRAGARCYDESWRFAWMVRLLPASESALNPFDVSLVYFTAGSGRAGDRLRTFGSTHLECIITRAKPAHTEVIFSYPMDPEPALWFDFIA